MIGRSLQWRLLLGAAVAILVALAVAWAFMTVLFERHLDRRLEAELTREALVLVAGLSLDAQGAPQVDAAPADARLQTPAGGFYWQARTKQGAARSRSLWDADLAVAAGVPRKSWRLRDAEGPFDEPVAILERELVLGETPVTVQLAQDTRPLRTASVEFGRELATFLAVLWLVLSAAAWLQVSLGLRPLRRIRGDLDALRANAHARLPAAHLREIQPLADAINALAEARERDLSQARRRAADLAHGLKTPLAALAAQSRRARDAGAEAAALGMEQALSAIGATVDAELARVRVASAGEAATAAVREVIERLVTVLEHTDAGSRVAFEVDIDGALQAPLSADALSEIAGALLENAVRHARRRVRVTARHPRESGGPVTEAARTALDSRFRGNDETSYDDSGEGVHARRSHARGNPGAEPPGAPRLDSRFRGNEGRAGRGASHLDSLLRGNDEVELIIEDDGAGIAGDRLDDVLTRGVRLDEAGAGTGLGLAIARDLVAATRGTLALGQSPLGGLAVRLAWTLSPSASRD